MTPERRQARYLYESLSALLASLSDRLAETDTQDIHELNYAGEWGVALEMTADALSEYEIPISDEERATMLALHQDMQMDGRVPGALSFCPRLG